VIAFFYHHNNIVCLDLFFRSIFFASYCLLGEGDIMSANTQKWLCFDMVPSYLPISWRRWVSVPCTITHFIASVINQNMLIPPMSLFPVDLHLNCVSFPAFITSSAHSLTTSSIVFTTKFSVPS
jgi:hypothetical protein